MNDPIIVDDFNYLFQIGETSIFPQKDEVSNYQSILNLFRNKFKKHSFSRLFFLNLFLKFSFHFIEKTPAWVIFFSILDTDLFYFLNKKKKNVFFSFSRFSNKFQSFQFSFFQDNLVSLKVSSVLILPNFFSRFIFNLEKFRKNLCFELRTIELCLLTMANSLHFFFDKSILEHSLTLVKEKFDFSLDLNGFKDGQERIKSGGGIFVDKLSILYKIVLYELKTNRRYMKESSSKKILYFLRNLRFVFSTPNSEKKNKFYKKVSQSFFLKAKPTSMKFKKYYKKKKKLEIEKHFIELHFSLSLETSKDRGCWVIYKLINLFHFRFFNKYPHLLNHFLLSFFSSFPLENKYFYIIRSFFFTNHLAMLNINKFSSCLKSFLTKTIENSKEMDLRTQFIFSDLKALYFTNLSLKTIWNSVKFKPVLFPRTLWFFNQILENIFRLNTIELTDPRIHKTFFIQKKNKLFESDCKKKKIESLRNLLVQKKANPDCSLFLRKSVRILFSKKLKIGISVFLSSLLFSNWPISFTLILMDKYSSFFFEISISEAIRFIILKTLLDLGSSFIFSKIFILLEKLISIKVLNINQIGREILRKKFFKSLTIIHVLKNLINFKEKMISNKYSVEKDKDRFREYLNHSNVESKKFIMNAYFNANKAEKLWKKQLKDFENSVIENIFLLTHEFLIHSNSFFFSYIHVFSNPFFFILNFFISFWENFLEHRESFFVFKNRTRKNNFLF